MMAKLPMRIFFTSPSSKILLKQATKATGGEKPKTQVLKQKKLRYTLELYTVAVVSENPQKEKSVRKSSLWLKLFCETPQPWTQIPCPSYLFFRRFWVQVQGRDDWRALAISLLKVFDLGSQQPKTTSWHQDERNSLEKNLSILNHFNLDTGCCRQEGHQGVHWYQRMSKRTTFSELQSNKVWELFHISKFYLVDLDAFGLCRICMHFVAIIVRLWIR